MFGAINPFLAGASGLLTGFGVLLTAGYLLKPRRAKLEAETELTDVKKLIAMYDMVARDRDHWQELAQAYEVKLRGLGES